MNKKYLEYLYKSKKTTVAFVCIVFLLLYTTMLVVERSDNGPIVGLVSVTIATGVLIYLLVPVIYGYIHSKKAVDSYFSLPVSRREQLITSQIFIDLMLIAPFTATMLLTCLISITNRSFLFQYALLYYVIVVVSIIALVGFNTMLFSLANSTFDGIVMMLGYALVPAMAAGVIDVFVENIVYGLSTIDLSSFAELTSLFASSSSAISNACDCLYNLSLDSQIYVNWMICVIWHDALTIYGLRNNYINRKVERAETVSNRFTSYPFLIYFYTFSLLFICVEFSFDLRGFQFEEFIIFAVLIFIAFSIANFVYKRKIKVLLKDVLFFVITTLIAFGLVGLSNMTSGFGLAWSYDKNPNNVVYNVSYYVNYDYLQKDEDILTKMIKDNYEGVNDYSILISTAIADDEMTKEKETIDYFENIRTELINKYYNDNDQLYGNCGTFTVQNNMIFENYDYGSAIRYGRNTVTYDYMYYANEWFETKEDIIELLNKATSVDLNISTYNDYYTLNKTQLIKLVSE